MKRISKACALVLGGLLAFPALAAAQAPGGWGPGGGQGRGFGGPMPGFLHNERMKAELGLTDEQAEKLHQIFLNSRKANIRTRADLKIRQMELHELLRADNTDRNAALKKVQEVSALREQMMQQHVESMLAAKAVLTPEQLEKFHAMMADRMSRRGRDFRGRRGSRRWQGGPGGPGGGPQGFQGPGGPPPQFAPEPDEN